MDLREHNCSMVTLCKRGIECITPTLYNLLDMENEINDEQKEILLTLRSLADQNVFVDAVINSICGNFNDLGPVNDKVKRSNVLSTQSSICSR
jgi:hypothetical protein